MDTERIHPHPLGDNQALLLAFVCPRQVSLPVMVLSTRTEKMLAYGVIRPWSWILGCHSALQGPHTGCFSEPKHAATLAPTQWAVRTFGHSAEHRAFGVWGTGEHPTLTQFRDCVLDLQLLCVRCLPLLVSVFFVTFGVFSAGLYSRSLLYWSAGQCVLTVPMWVSVLVLGTTITLECPEHLQSNTANVLLNGASPPPALLIVANGAARSFAPF